MKEINNLYTTIASLFTTSQGGDDDKDRCKKKRKRCMLDNPRISTREQDLCISDAVQEAFENAPHADPLEIMCEAAKVACICEQEHQRRVCERNVDIGACMEGVGDGSPDDAPCYPPHGTPTNCNGPFGLSPLSWCSSFCTFCPSAKKIDICEGATQPTTSPDDPNFWACELLIWMISQWEKANCIELQGCFKGPFAAEYWNCKRGAGACVECDCKKDLADNLKALAYFLRRMKRNLECFFAGSNEDLLSFSAWCFTFDVDECKEGLDCPVDNGIQEVDIKDSVDVDQKGMKVVV